MRRETKPYFHSLTDEPNYGWNIPRGSINKITKPIDKTFSYLLLTNPQLACETSPIMAVSMGPDGPFKITQ